MLAVPGALLALGLVYLAALGTVDRDRRELALLRARGASRRALLGLAGVESAIVGLVAGLLGAGVSFLAVATLVKGSVGADPGTGRGRRSPSASRWRSSAASSPGSGPACARWRKPWRPSVAARAARRQPLWQRLYLDLLRWRSAG